MKVSPPNPKIKRSRYKAAGKYYAISAVLSLPLVAFIFYDGADKHERAPDDLIPVLSAISLGVSITVILQFLTGSLAKVKALKEATTLKNILLTFSASEVMVNSSTLLTATVALYYKASVLHVIAVMLFCRYMGFCGVIGILLSNGGIGPGNEGLSVISALATTLLMLGSDVFQLIIFSQSRLHDHSMHEYTLPSNNDTLGIFSMILFILFKFLMCGTLVGSLSNWSFVNWRQILSNLTNTHRSLEIATLPCALVLVSAIEVFVFLIDAYSVERGTLHMPSMMACYLTGHMFIAYVAESLPSIWSVLDASHMKTVLKTKGEFSRYISHEIRSPLSSLSLGLAFMTEMISRDPVIDRDNVIDALNDCTEACASSITIVSDLLLFDKIEQNMLELEKTFVKPKALVDPILKQFKLLVHSAGLTLDVSIEHVDENLCCRADKTKIHQVLRNFLTNAVKFSRVNTTISVRVSTSLVGPTYAEATNLPESTLLPPACRVLTVEVTDRGVGIAKKNLGSLFGQYVQFDAKKNQGGNGSGLGLWLSKEIIHMHTGGEIGATSELGEGSTFFFKLPCYDISAVSESISQGSSSYHDNIQANNTKVTPMPNEAIAKLSKKHLESNLNAAHATVGHIAQASLPPNEDSPEEALKICEVRSDEVTVPRSPINYKGPQPHSKGEDATNIKANSKSRQEEARQALEGSDDGGVFKSGSRSSSKSSINSTDRQDIPSAMKKLNSKRSDRIEKFVTFADRQKVGDNALLIDSFAGVLKVLIADDVAVSRKMVARVISSLTREIHFAEDGEAAVNRVQHSMKVFSPYDVVLVDYQMPKLNGVEAVKLMRELEYEGVIFMVTGVSSVEEKRKMIEAGCNDVLEKPLQMDRFRSAVCGLAPPSSLSMVSTTSFTVEE